MATGADHTLDVSLHDQLQDRLGDGAEKSPSSYFSSSSASDMLVLVIDGPFGDKLKSANSTLTVHLDRTLLTPPTTAEIPPPPRTLTRYRFARDLVSVKSAIARSTSVAASG